MVCLAQERLSTLLSHLGVVRLMETCSKVMRHVLVGECSAAAIAAARGEVSAKEREKLLRNRHLCVLFLSADSLGAEASPNASVRRDQLILATIYAVAKLDQLYNRGSGTTCVHRVRQRDLQLPGSG